MSKLFDIVIATPEREVWRGQADSISIPTVDGEITVLAHHIPVASLLRPGELQIRNGSEVQPFAVSGGFVEVQAQQVVILADTAERADEIDAQRAQEAITRAEKVRAEHATDHAEYAAATIRLERDLVRMRVVKKYGHRGHHGAQAPLGVDRKEQ